MYEQDFGSEGHDDYLLVNLIEWCEGRGHGVGWHCRPGLLSKACFRSSAFPLEGPPCPADDSALCSLAFLFTCFGKESTSVQPI